MPSPANGGLDTAGGVVDGVPDLRLGFEFFVFIARCLSLARSGGFGNQVRVAGFVLPRSRIVVQEEFLALLKKHRIEYEEWYLWK